jgi:hypothetical protein
VPSPRPVQRVTGGVEGSPLWLDRPDGHRTGRGRARADLPARRVDPPGVRAYRRAPTTNTGGFMYIGGGVIALILIVLLILWLF